MNSTADRTIISTRTFSATREQLFEAWRNPALLATWWGPKGFTNTFYEFDFRAGGYWRFTMHGPDGGNYENETKFLEILAPEWIAADHISNPQFRIEFRLEAVEAGTTITWKMIFKTPEECEKLRGLVVGANEENLDRLQAVLEKMKV